MSVSGQTAVEIVSPTILRLNGRIHEVGGSLETAPPNYLYIGRQCFTDP